ncbi:MAG: septum formation initiator family protein [Candidatus Pacebacteria bacterium]|nr:septum formation initiator family protein [Candidatus Paceibacterota bacterium]
MITKKEKNQKGRDLQTIIFSVLLGLFLVGIVSSLIVSNFRISQKRSEMLEKIEKLQNEIRAIEEKNENLKSGLLETETDAYWEERMREQGYQKPGEEVVVVLPSEKEEEAQIEKTLWDKIREKIGF